MRVRMEHKEYDLWYTEYLDAVQWQSDSAARCHMISGQFDNYSHRAKEHGIDLSDEKAIAEDLGFIAILSE